MRRILFYIPFFMTAIFIVGGNDDDLGDEPYVFREELVKSITKVGNAGEIEPQYQFKLKKLCFTAKKIFSLPYINVDTDRDFRWYKFVYLNKNIVESKAIHYHTLPAAYLRPGNDPNEILVTTIESSAHTYEFDTEDNIFPTSIDLNVYLNWIDVQHELNLHERQHLCLEARKHLLFTFVDNYVNDSLIYEFVYERESRIYNAISCPTYPPVYLHFHEDENRITIIYFKTTFGLEIVEDIRPSIQGDEEDESILTLNNEVRSNIQKFRGNELNLISNGQEEKWSEELNEKLLWSLRKTEIEELCKDGKQRLRNASHLLANKIKRPHLYIFDHGNGQIRKRSAVRCSPGDEMFLNSEKSNSGIKIKFAVNQVYVFVFFETTQRTLDDKIIIQIFTILLALPSILKQ